MSVLVYLPALKCIHIKVRAYFRMNGIGFSSCEYYSTLRLQVALGLLDKVDISGIEAPVDWGSAESLFHA
jgi:hypothetical protein